MGWERVVFVDLHSSQTLESSFLIALYNVTHTKLPTWQYKVQRLKLDYLAVSIGHSLGNTKEERDHIVSLRRRRASGRAPTFSKTKKLIKFGRFNRKV